MSSFERIDIKKRWPIPPALKLILLVAVILGLVGRKCWMKNPGRNLQISEIEITEVTKVSADVKFTVANRAKISLKKSVLIKIFSPSGELIASKIAWIEIPAKSRKRYLKVLQKFNFPIDNPDEIVDVTVDFYK
ncbi:MAG: hypothetical protein HQ534_01125 [Armatimonadetes bacterium]|nr:hypothetical protein [Armatimonadota bacterium]